MKNYMDNGEVPFEEVDMVERATTMELPIYLLGKIFFLTLKQSFEE